MESFRLCADARSFACDASRTGYELHRTRSASLLELFGETTNRYDRRRIYRALEKVDTNTATQIRINVFSSTAGSRMDPARN